MSELHQLLRRPYPRSDRVARDQHYLMKRALRRSPRPPLKRTRTYMHCTDIGYRRGAGSSSSNGWKQDRAYGLARTGRIKSLVGTKRKPRILRGERSNRQRIGQHGCGSCPRQGLHLRTADPARSAEPVSSRETVSVNLDKENTFPVPEAVQNWVNVYKCLEGAGYVRRTRYHPEWVRSGVGTKGM
ncbi:hypothetical protein CALCODRAFT_491639 [Calocera cornea HHB12733]|uniref:Uncharacterized protein n=1 Tax=Calocera cornea HHB12733 TaxID=1353952 RepID=A0A165IUJ2_9BASI|nr:hypothetical protein CALCODRAFT_491639 [Calocera cornea HHB12733]